MSGKKLQGFFFVTPVFKNLTWQFHKIPINAGTRKTRIMCVCQHSMQGMTKLMEKGCNLIKSQQRRFAGSGFGEIANDGNMWTSVFPALYLLRFIGSHPSSITLSRTRMEVGVKDGNQFSFIIFHIICFYIRMIFVDVIHLFKMKSV